jgi:hypothetical protein
MEAEESEILENLLFFEELVLAAAADNMLFSLAVLNVCAQLFLQECLADILLANLAFHGMRIFRLGL